MLPRGFAEGVAGAIKRRLTTRVDAAQAGRVALGGDANPRLDRLGFIEADQGHVRELRVGGVVQEEFG